MSRGNSIIVSANPRGVFEEGYVKTSQTFFPGMIVQKDPTVALIGNVFTFKIYSRTNDGDRPAGAWWVVLENYLLGKLMTDSTGYVAGDRCFLYSPALGEELNLLLLDIAGTGDVHNAGEVLIVKNNSGKLIATTGSPQCEVALLLETIPAPLADTLAWCSWMGF